MTHGAGITLAVGILLAGDPGAVQQSSPCPEDLEILVERSLAAREGLQPGDRVHLSGAPRGPECPARVAGIYEPRADPSRLARERPGVRLHLPHLLHLIGREGEVDRFSVLLREGVELESVRVSLAVQMPGAQVVPTAEVVGRASTTFEVVRRFHRAIGLITLAAGGAFLACIMILKVQERRTPVAALRLLGVSRRTVVGWLFLEAAIVSALGGMIGVGLGWAASAVINRYYQSVYQTTLVFSLVTGEVVALALGLALVLGALAGAAATARLLAIAPLEEAGR